MRRADCRAFHEMNWRIVPLSELCEMDRRTARPDDPSVASLPFVGVENVERDTGRLDLAAGSRTGNRKSTAFRFHERHVLYGKLGPYLNKVATPDFAGVCSTELVPLLPRRGVDRDFLASVLRRRSTVEFAIAYTTGARMPRTDMNMLMTMPTPFPPPDEQRRIASALKKVSRIELLRAEALTNLNKFASALFIKMFGAPDSNSMKWRTRPFLEAVEDGTRRVKKIKKRDYGSGAGIPIIDQGQHRIAGYASGLDGCYDGEFPVIIFGDHTTRFKLVRSPFFLGADGTKLLISKTPDLDPVFLYSHLQLLDIPVSGYKRHFNILTGKTLMIPSLDRQTRFRHIYESIDHVGAYTESAVRTISTLRESITNRLLESAPARH